MKRLSPKMHLLLQLEKDAWSRKELNDRGFNRIVIVDDCPKTTALMKEFLRDLPKTEVLTFNNEFEALKTMATDLPDLMILDVCLTTIDGRKLAHLMKEINGAPVPIIFMSFDERLLKNEEFSLKKPLTKQGLKNYLEYVLVKNNRQILYAS